MRNVDEHIRKLHNPKSGQPINYPQVALVALDPHTGQIRAPRRRGRNYGRPPSLDHAHRPSAPTGSHLQAFRLRHRLQHLAPGARPLGDGGRLHRRPPRINGQPPGLRPERPILHPRQTLKKASTPAWSPPPDALAHSLNIATIAPRAKRVGYEKRSRARPAQAGIVQRPAPTPSGPPIGTYNATPIDMGRRLHGLRQRRRPALTPWGSFQASRNLNGGHPRRLPPRSQTSPWDPRVRLPHAVRCWKGVMARGTASSVPRPRL